MGGERMLCEEGALEGTVSLCFGYSTISLAWAPRGKVYVELCTTTLIRVFVACMLGSFIPLFA